LRLLFRGGVDGFGRNNGGFLFCLAGRIRLRSYHFFGRSVVGLNGRRFLVLLSLLLLLLLVWLFSDFTLLPGLLLARKVRVQKYHTVVHNLEVLAQQTKVAIELTQ